MQLNLDDTGGARELALHRIKTAKYAGEYKANEKFFGKGYAAISARPAPV